MVSNAAERDTYRCDKLGLYSLVRQRMAVIGTKGDMNRYAATSAFGTNQASPNVRCSLAIGDNAEIEQPALSKLDLRVQTLV
jgi:hypothetical protein